ncbi:MAG TPA: hypothetical protein P5567_11690 [Kiritimatiellia bacterium]|nr:hypothetical protein [Kiritimatiellia bacterium]HRZ13102.1 hypothetical protein [Kiritimatiellia bacterium]HSA17523.1 hypothetical protein [Kiritimatiellia bacterium]
MKISHEELLLYAGGELTPDRRARVEEALRSDPEARKALAEFQEQEARLARLPVLEPGRDLVAPALTAARRRKTARVLFLYPAWRAAAAALLLLLGGAAWRLWRRAPGIQVARDTTHPPAGLVSDDELAVRLSQLRAAVGGLAPAAPAPALEPEETFAADVKERLETLQGLCRSQVAATRPARPGADFDRRMQQLKSQMDTAREDLLKIEIPADDEIAGRGAPTIQRNTTIRVSLRGYPPLKGPAARPVCQERSPS